MNNNAWIRAVLAREMAPLTRRAFLRYAGVGTLTWLGAPLWLPGETTVDLAVVKGAGDRACRAAVGLLGGMEAFVRPGDKVVVKPNMSFNRGEASGTTTTPAVVREVVAMCLEAGAKRVRVLDHPLRKDERCIEGVRESCAPFGRDLVQGLWDRDLFLETPIPAGRSLKQTSVMRDVLAAERLIAVPTAKSHGATGVSLSLKGMMGLVWNRSVMHWRHDLSEAIVDLGTLLKPDLVIVDATYVLSTEGPSGPGRVLQENTVIAARDMVAADALTVQLFPWYGRRMQPRQVGHIRLAHERGLGRMDVENLAVKQAVV